MGGVVSAVKDVVVGAVKTVVTAATGPVGLLLNGFISSVFRPHEVPCGSGGDSGNREVKIVYVPVVPPRLAPPAPPPPVPGLPDVMPSRLHQVYVHSVSCQ